jgi:hypothetical protein
MSEIKTEDVNPYEGAENTVSADKFKEVVDANDPDAIAYLKKKGMTVDSFNKNLRYQNILAIVGFIILAGILLLGPLIGVWGVLGLTILAILGFTIVLNIIGKKTKVLKQKE